LRKATISFVIFVCSSIRVEQLGSHWTEFYDIWYYSFCRRSVQIVRVTLKSDKNSWYFTYRHIYIYHISIRSSLNEKCFIQNLQSEIKEHILCPIIFFFENRTFCEKKWKKYGSNGHATDDNMAHAHCMLDD
jgi:hypothetical protein